MRDEKSEMLEAADLVILDIESMSLADLQDHADKVLDALNRLNQLICYPVDRSANTIISANRRTRKLRAHMNKVRGLIIARVNAIAAATPPNSTSGTLSQILLIPPTV